MARAKIEHSRLLQVLSYDPLTGIFTWLDYPGADPKFSETMPGKVAGSLDRDGYVRITVEGIYYAAHRLAWFYKNGVWPVGIVDHRDRTRTNNRIKNLRDTTHKKNAFNRKMPASNTSGFKGVSRDVRSGKWLATICKNRRVRRIGLFESAEAASAAYEAKASELFGDFYIGASK